MIQHKYINLGKYTSRRANEEIPLHLEKYSCLSEMEESILKKGRSLVDPDHDFFEKGYVRPSFNGFSSSEELRMLLRSGVNDTSAVRQVCRLKASRNAKDAVRTKKFDLMGEEVDVPAYLSGIPECMVDEVRVRKPYRGIRLVLDPIVSGNVTGKELTEAGLILARLVMALEKTGRSVHLSVYSAFLPHEKDEVYFMSCDIKRSGTPLNAKKLLMCTHPSFFRGAGFTWIARTADYCLNGLGATFSYIVNRHDMTLQLLKENIYSDKDLYLVRVKDVLDMLDECKRTPGWENRLVNQLFEEFIR